MYSIEVGLWSLLCESDRGDLWITITGRGPDHICPHPDYKRWAILKEEWETLIYLGPVFIAWTSGRTKRAKREWLREQARKKWMERFGEPHPFFG